MDLTQISKSLGTVGVVSLILAGLLCGLASCADPPRQPSLVIQQPSPVIQQPPPVVQQPSPVIQQPPPVVQQPPRVVQQQPLTQQQVEARMRVNSSELMCTAHGNDLLECQLRAQLLETCLETHNYAPCSNLAPMRREPARPTPRESECHWEYERWVCREQ